MADVTEHWAMVPENGTQFLPSPPMRLTDFLPLMRLRDTGHQEPRPVPNGRVLSNADIIATIENVLDIVGHIENPANNQDEDMDPAVSS